jgi:hypothetical protein
MSREEIEVQEIFVKVKFSPDTKIHERTFAWRTINANKLWIKNVSLNEETNEVSFTSEFNIEFSKEQIKQVIQEKTHFSSGEGLSLKIIYCTEIVEIKEEAEIYGNE